MVSISQRADYFISCDAGHMDGIYLGNGESIGVDNGSCLVLFFHILSNCPNQAVFCPNESFFCLNHCVSCPNPPDFCLNHGISRENEIISQASR